MLNSPQPDSATRKGSCVRRRTGLEKLSWRTKVTAFMCLRRLSLAGCFRKTTQRKSEFWSLVSTGIEAVP